MYIPTYKSEAGSNVMQCVHIVMLYSYYNYLFIMFTYVVYVIFLCVCPAYKGSVFLILYTHLGIIIFKSMAILMYWSFLSVRTQGIIMTLYDFINQSLWVI